MAPRGPQKGQKSILMGSLVVLDPNASPKKISSIFGTGCHKACTCPLNGANYQPSEWDQGGRYNFNLILRTHKNLDKNALICL